VIPRDQLLQRHRYHQRWLLLCVPSQLAKVQACQFHLNRKSTRRHPARGSG
jgi:hypothetical protein